jgi:RNA polymerase sigma factor (sigma-70 family)
MDFQRQSQKYIDLDQFSSEADREEELLGYEMSVPPQVFDREFEAEYAERADILNKAISTLSESEQRIVMAYAQDVDPSKLAQELGISGTTLRVMRHRIFSKLRRRL